MIVNHNCLHHLAVRGAKDGERRSCHECNKVWIFTVDEHIGNYWLPDVRRDYVKEGKHTKAAIAARRKQHEAQSVYLFPRRKKR